MPKVSEAARYVCMAFEGFAPKPYVCPAGVLTQGFGHTAAAGRTTPQIGADWTIEDGVRIFADTFSRYAERTATQLGPETVRRLNDNQFGALASFVYNTGSLYLKDGRPSGLLRAVREGRDADVGRELMKWTMAGGRSMPGLQRRRRAEAALYAGNPREAIRLAGPIPLIDSKGRVCGTAELPPGPGRPNVATLYVPDHPHAGEEAAPTASQPSAPASDRDAAVSAGLKKRSPAVAAGGAASVSVPVAVGATGASLPVTLVTAVAVLAIIVTALIWWLTSLRDDADVRYAAGVGASDPLPPPEIDPYPTAGQNFV